MKSSILAWLCAMIVVLGLAENRAWGFFEQPQPAPGQIALTSPESIGENYDASRYDASDYAVAARTGAGMGDDAGRYLYHYTSPSNADNILAKGFDTRYSSDGALYFTNRGNLSPIQAQIELALPANRPLPGSLLRIDAGALERAGISPFIGPRRVQGNLPGLGAGGGTEFLFNQNIPSQFIQRVR